LPRMLLSYRAEFLFRYLSNTFNDTADAADNILVMG
jgi:hypothetical protein